MFDFREELKIQIFPCYQPLILDEGKDDLSENQQAMVFYETKDLPE